MIPQRLLPQTATVEAYKGTGAYGRPVYYPPVTVRCRVEREWKLVRDKAGAEVVVAATVFLQPDVNCPVDSLITIAGEAAGRTVVASRGVWDAYRIHHLEVELK